MKYNTFTLSNGLRIIHRPLSSQVVYCGYGINAGTRNEEPGEEGLAHFCEHATFKGTSRRRAFHIINSLESVGGELNAFTNKADTVYYAAILKDHLDRAVDLLTDIVFHSVYPEAELEKEKEVVCDEIESYNDSPAELIYDDFENIIFEGHPLGHNILGTSDKVRGYGHDDAMRFTSRFYLPPNAIFFAYGDVDFNRLVRLLEKGTSDFPDATPWTESLKSPVSSVGEAMSGYDYHPQKKVVDRNTHQAHVMIGNRAYSVHDNKRMALYLINNILGGPGMNARLNLALREHNGLVYTVESSMANYSDTGVWAAYFGCDAHDIDKCLRLTRRELDKFISAPLSEYQLRAAKKQLKGQIAIACDNNEGFAIDFAKSFLHYGWERDITHLMGNIDAITSEQIQEVAREIFAEDKMTTLIFK